MKRSIFLMIALSVILVVSISGLAQDLSSPAKGTIVAPPSSLVRTPGKVHTPLYIFIPEGGVDPSTPTGENPASIACIYGVTPPSSGCKKSSTIVPNGGTKAIAVVEYGRYSAMQSDFNIFNTQWGLPTQTIVEICTPGPPPCPSNNGTGWDLETALDVQYAHAMAPNAQIIVAEFTNDPLLDGAETQAAQYIVTNFGAGEISNSWTYNGGEFSGELGYDGTYFSQHGIVYFGSAGDSGLGPEYPSISPNVVSAGGTRVQRDSNGNFTTESCWSGSGGGISHYEPLPQYQLIIGNKTGPKRGSPDWAADADPNSGVAVYSSSYCHGWCPVGGTSASSPILAGIVNQAGSFASVTSIELSKTYTWYRNPGTYRTNMFDVTTGSNGSPAGPGWDQCTGLGSPRKASAF